jgi:two-component system response regulator AtoC
MGCFELADGGTIFLDEVAEMKVPTQAKFLRILQEGSFRRLGGKTEIRVDVRIVAATNKDPAQAVHDGLLREDLYYRLNVFSLHLPPLRERREDIPLLVERFRVERNERYGLSICGLTPPALAALRSHAWPGNLAELKSVLTQAMILQGTGWMGPEELGLPPAPRGPRRRSDGARQDVASRRRGRARIAAPHGARARRSSHARGRRG